MTRGDELLASVDAALHDLDGYRLAHYRSDQVRDVVQRLGSITERFFKSAVWPGTPAEVTLDTLIGRLKRHGLDKATRSALHALRELYNDAKHDSAATIGLKGAHDTILRARAALVAVLDLGLGSSAAEVSQATSRLLWVGAWDDYVGGLTEVYISLPLPGEPFATHVDVVHIAGLSWDAMRAELLATTCFHLGPDHFAPDDYHRYAAEGDFLAAGVWDGDYRQLVAILSRYERREAKDELIPGLRRDHMPLAVLSAVVLAATDVAAAAAESRPADALAREILARADAAYAMPDERPWVRRRAEEIAALIAEAPFDTWRTLSGPYWELWDAKGRFTRRAEASPVGYSLDEQGRIVIGHVRSTEHEA